MNIGWQEAIPIILIIVLLFGARKLPELARALGRSVSEFKKGRDEGMKPDDKTTEENSKKT